MGNWIRWAIVINAVTILSLFYLMVRYAISDGDTYLQYGDRLMAFNSEKERRFALRAYERALAAGSWRRVNDPLHAWKGLAKGYLYLKEYRRALDALNEALRYDADDPWLWDSKGDAHLAIEDSIQALESYSAAFRLEPENVGVCQKTGDLLSDLRRLEEGIRVYKACLAADSTAAHLAHFWGLIGSLHIQEKDYAASEAALQTALQHDPERMISWVRLSILFRSTGRLDEELDALNRAVLLDNERGVAWFYRALTRARRGETELAREDLAMAIRMDSTIVLSARTEPELSFYFEGE
ncbi:MAG: tetratricopeptide repeat protein [Gemmatimonadota bacterium]|nr:tetratricopeptide repeat protein [Gemmatimonadota bacterium]